MKAVFPILLLLLGSLGAFGDNLVKEGSFESPVVSGRTPALKGGDVTNNGRGPGWVALQTSGTGSAITLGLTNETGHTGSQSIYLQFNHVSAADPGVALTSGFIPVVSGTTYEAGIWGRMDAKAPLDPQGRSAYLKLEVDFFAKDAYTSVGEPVYAVQPLPGSKNHEAYFKSDSWKRFHYVVQTPPGAVFAQMTWRWETETDDGETNGVIFFDDADLIGPPNPVPDLTPAPVEQPTPDASTSPAAQ